MKPKHPFAFVRANRIRSIQDLTAMQNHARRLDEAGRSRIRPGAQKCAGLDWPPQLAPTENNPGRGYVQAFRDLKKRTGAGERKNAPLGVHLLVGVSPEWIAAAGDLHSPANPRNRQLIEQAVTWANGWSNGGVFSARLDLDEAGGGVIDLFVAPIEEQRHKSGRSKPVISVNKSLERLAIEHTGRRSQHYAALNTSWAEHASTHLDANLRRGISKEVTQREHLPIDEYKRVQDQLATQRQELAEREAALAEREAATVAKEAELEAKLNGLEHGLELLANGKLDCKNGKWTAPPGSPEVLKPIWGALQPIARKIADLRAELGAIITAFRPLLELYKVDMMDGIEAQQLIDRSKQAGVRPTTPDDNSPSPF